MSQRPQIRAGGLSGRIFAITSYNKFSDGRIEAKEKFDVTEDVIAAVRKSKFVLDALRAEQIQEPEL